MSHLFYWEEILWQIHLIQKKPQEPGIGEDVCVTDMDEMKIFFDRSKDTLLSESVNQSKTKPEEEKIPTEERIRRKRKLPGERVDGVCQTLVPEVKSNLYTNVIIDLSMNGKHDLTPCLICKLSSLDYYHM